MEVSKQQRAVHNGLKCGYRAEKANGKADNVSQKRKPYKSRKKAKDTSKKAIYAVNYRQLSQQIKQKA